ncbi:MAG: hypothetical protein HOJ07_00995 [Rhodospirillaceae bacterium]|jgi:pilus assembly protein CpaD|nr:hypothetical protein [Rhodospirillaceae bacterium]MBT3927216.1 hypothetical protein [Rhodospirillaceae bacterium]MBT5674238.1 hypothetical protein [Rhodospirillaceae bacterium]MBT5780398.1 hypothetical protein [Rhodospirillaceae bacterium]MBT6829394.1 hypothetical protein [Rhodospirillaceae bacterium]
MTAKIDNSGGLRGWRLLSLALLLVTASACAPIADNWRPGDSAKANTVAWTVSRHEVQFEPGTDRAVAGEAARLKLFLANIDLRRPLHVFVGAGAADTQLVAWRNATTHALLRDYGITVRADPPPAEAGRVLSSQPTGANSAVILAGRFEVRVTGCPDWRKPLLDEYTNYESSNLGCANANNLALMIADPEDLLRGRESGPSDGTRAAKTVRDYKSGALPALPESGSAFLSVPASAGGS